VLSKIDDIPNNEMTPIYEAFIDWKNQRFLDDLSADVRRGLGYVVNQGYWPGGFLPLDTVRVARLSARSGMVSLATGTSWSRMKQLQIVLRWRGD
jgi:hypothetical protein